MIGRATNGRSYRLLRRNGGRHWIVLVVSTKGLSTREVYQNLPRKRPPVSLTKINRTVKLIAAFLKEKKYGRAAGLLQNDLESSAFVLRPSLQQIIANISKQGIELVRMTGSGPTIFAVLFRLENVRRLAKILRNQFPSKKIILCHTF